MVKRIGISCLMILGIMSIASSQHVLDRKSWDTFKKDPLEIIYPEDQALSNPPFIHWQPVQNAASYKITLTGQNDETSNWTTSFNSYTPEKPFPQGFYTVKLMAFDQSGEKLEYETEKLFEISIPGNGFYPSMNQIRFEKGKPIILPEDQLEELRKVKGERGEYREKVLAHANAPLPEPLQDLKEPEAFGVHWEFKLWKDNEIVCFAVEEYLLHQTLAYRLTEDRKYLDNARAILNKVVEWDPEGPTGVWENDHSAHSILHSLSITYNQLGKDLPETERKKLANNIEARCRDMYGLLNPFMAKETAAGWMNDPDNNHPWFCTAALGLGALSLMGEVPEAEEWLTFVTQMFYGCYFPRGGKDGGWHEGLEYWSFNLFFVVQYSSALKETTGIDLYQHPWLKNTALFKMYVHPPVGSYVPFGDVKHNPPNDYDKMVMMHLASVYEDPLAWKYVDSIEAELSENRLYYGLLWSDRGNAANKPIPEVPFAKLFRDIGWAVSNNNLFDADEQIILALHSGKFFGRRCNHSHADQNSFVIAAGGDKLLWDAGYYDSYLSPHHRYYSRLTMAHNTILVNGVGQVPYTNGTDGMVSKFEVDGDHVIMEGDAATCKLVYGGWLVKYLRNIEYQNENEFVIQDDIFCSEYSNVTYLLHSCFPITYTPGDQTIFIKGNKYQLEGKLETDEPLEVVMKTKFPVDPNLPADHIFKVASVYPDQYHLELTTINKVETWKPRLVIKLSRIAEE